MAKLPFLLVLFICYGSTTSTKDQFGRDVKACAFGGKYNLNTLAVATFKISNLDEEKSFALNIFVFPENIVQSA